MQVLKQSRPREDRGVFSILETLDVDTGKRTVLKEFDDTMEAPNWAKDGKYLIYNRNGKIYRYELAAGNITEIYTGAITDCNNDHVLSPDGKSIAVSHGTFEDGLSRIYTLPLSGGEPALITPIAPSYLHGWSPDGKTLAYCAERNGQYDIYTIPVWGGRERQITNEKSLDDGPEYSPDGKHIWFNSTRTGLMQLWRMEADGSNPVQMTHDENANSWFGHVSPDGKRIAYISYRKGDVEPDKHPPNKDVELRLMNASGGDYKTIAKFFGGQGTINVNSWSPDNKTIAFVSYRLK
ncbi:TolB family protein [Leadbettera azotonutricia]|uniref:Periplasmic component of the Tol biopolymer transport system n=1 Tax=Leadbettera azotonutricia (strain ATCC BAA-888 / DSM 13862 / ZAS-9) TaxID=545695 RepID=F5YAI9_LEAAZ|nr:PD40 domain-containing protein [Leadbettera azotonutricia]AEF80220.1 periplasmic component of the Tol biopolymer transport system [Leadbettera azotonutricia ZAS-9]